MKNVKVLDCTLRDGGRIIDCRFNNNEIKEICSRLSDAKIDIIEVGFLRDCRKIAYVGNSTFFTDVDQIKPFLDKTKTDVMYVAFIDYGMFDINSLKAYDGTSIDGIRFGFTKKNYYEAKEDIFYWMQVIKEKGYKLFVQGVNSLNYNDKELIEVVEMINSIHPYSFGIVDTYGAMYIDDVDRIYSLIDHNMLPDVFINFHSHNNYQLSFALAQEIIRLSSNSNRKVIIDGTLFGIGKVAGNLNIELLVDFLVRKYYYHYETDIIFDIIDNYIYKYVLKFKWGYSIPALMAGVYKSHPNNIIYLTEKFRLNSKDIGKLLSMINIEKRQSYDYDNIEKIYQEYSDKKINDYSTIKKLKEYFCNKEILVLVPGNSLNIYRDKVEKYINKYAPIVISVNFIFDSNMENWIFYGNQKRYSYDKTNRYKRKIIISSNINSDCMDDMIVNYYDLINREFIEYDNSTIMLLNLIRKIQVKKISIAGFDGFSTEIKDNFIDQSFQNDRHDSKKFNLINKDLSLQIKDFVKKIDDECEFIFLTPSYYKKYLKDTRIIFKDEITF